MKILDPICRKGEGRETKDKGERIKDKGEKGHFGDT
jgi:hypothetical protein